MSELDPIRARDDLAGAVSAESIVLNDREHTSRFSIILLITNPRGKPVD